jgi:hypothetical protein
MTPLTILIHELGHLSIPLIAGLPAELHSTSLSGGAELGVNPDWMVALQVGAGPLVSLIMSLWAARLYSADNNRLWALAVAVAAAGRFYMPAGYLAIRLFFVMLGRPFGGRPNFDELLVAQAIGVPAPLVAAVAALFLLGLYYWLFRLTDRRRRLPFIIALVAGIFIGAALWVTAVPATLAVIPAR